jgi:transmembrane sensor
MSANEDPVRQLVIEQAADWYLVNRESMNTEQRERFLQWLKGSPANIEEYLAVHRTALDLASIRAEPAAIDTLVAQARLESDSVVHRFVPAPRAAESVANYPWRPLAAAAALLLLIGAGIFLWQQRPQPPQAAAALMLSTGHGGQLTRTLDDGSVAHLNTDSVLVVDLTADSRTLRLERGEAAFEVAHEARPFRVLAGAAVVSAHGTVFAVRIEPGATLVTVMQGRVGVAPASASGAGAGPPAEVEVGANQQLRVSGSSWPAAPVTIDAHQATAWLRQQITFDNAPLAEVAAEFNRYGAWPIEIETPQLRALRISGVFATGDTEAFVDFLRSLPNVQVEVSAERIRVSQEPARRTAPHR